MRFALLSTVPNIGAADLTAIATACEPALAAVAAAWGPVYADVAAPQIRVVAAVADLTNDDVPVVFVPALDEPGDAAYHFIKPDEKGVQRPYALVLADESQPLPSVQQAAWHEMAEALVDPGCGRYDAAGFAIEVCDPVQSDDLAAGGVNLSPFVLPAWFGIGSGPVDSAGLLSTAHEVHAGGYAMKQDGSEIHGDGYRHAPCKCHPGCRRMKRRRAIESRLVTLGNSAGPEA